MTSVEKLEMEILFSGYCTKGSKVAVIVSKTVTEIFSVIYCSKSKKNEYKTHHSRYFFEQWLLFWLHLGK